MLPFLSQTTFNSSRTNKFRFIVYPQDKWIELIKRGLILEYINDCFDYIFNSSDNWYSIRVKKSKEDRFIFLDNQSLHISYGDFPRFFVEEKVIKAKDSLETFEKYFITGHKLETDNIEYVKYSKDEMMDIYKQ